jgi:hypothetical protein
MDPPGASEVRTHAYPGGQLESDAQVPLGQAVGLIHTLPVWACCSPALHAGPAVGCKHTPKPHEPQGAHAAPLHGCSVGMVVVVVVVVLVVAGVSPTSELTQVSTALSMVPASPMTRQPPALSAFPMASVNFNSAVVRQVESTPVPARTAFS